MARVRTNVEKLLCRLDTLMRDKWISNRIDKLANDLVAYNWDDEVRDYIEQPEGRKGHILVTMLAILRQTGTYGAAINSIRGIVEAAAKNGVDLAADQEQCEECCEMIPDNVDHPDCYHTMGCSKYLPDPDADLEESE